MEIKRGTGVSPGVAIGPALVLDTEGVRITRQRVAPEQVPEELARLRTALDAVAGDADQDADRITARAGAATGDIFRARAFQLRGPAFRAPIEAAIPANNYTAEYAVSRHIRGLLHQLQAALQRVGEAAGAAVRRQSAEWIDIEKQVLGYLLGHQSEPLKHLGEYERVIVLAHGPDAVRHGRLQPPARSGRSPPRAAGRPATPRSWPGPWKSRRWSGSGRS